MFGIYNMRRFKKQRTHSIWIFYICAVACLITRSAYFINRSIHPKTLQWYELFLTVLPSYLNISTVAAQLLTYLLLISSLNHYILVRDQLPEPEESELEMEENLSSKQFKTTFFLTLYIVMLPISFLV